MREVILKLLEEKSELPPLPDIVLRLQKLLKDRNANAKVVAGLIEIEPILAGKVLNLSNSVYYSRSAKPIKTLPVAITKLGFEMIIKLVYSLKLTKLFSDNAVLDSTKFWHHSLAVAIVTQALSKRITSTQEEQDIAYLSGLMHDVGVMVFGYLIPGEYTEFLKDAKNEEVPIEKQEKEKFGIEHAELGSLFINRWWQVDEKVEMAVKQHHYPFFGQDTDRRCEQLVNVANSVCNNQDITNGIQCYHEVFKEGAWEKLGFSPEDVTDILLDTKVSYDQALELMRP